MTFTTVVGLFNIFVGLMLVASFLLMGGGFIVWFVRRGTWPTFRDEAIGYMKWGVAILFVLVVLLAIVKFVQQHMAAASFIVGVVIVLLLVWFAITVLTAEKASAEDEH